MFFVAFQRCNVQYKLSFDIQEKNTEIIDTKVVNKIFKNLDVSIVHMTLKFASLRFNEKYCFY